MEIKHSRRSLLGLPILISLFLVGCSFIGPSRSVEIVSPAGQVDNINLTPRHYLALEHCESSVQKIPQSLAASLAPLTSEQKAKLTWPARIAAYKVKDCRSFKKRGEILNDFEDIFASKSQRIGVILPPSGGSEQALQWILEQVRRELTREGYHADKSLIFRRVEKNKEDALKAAAELVHMDRVAVLVGGVHQSHASALSQISDQTQTPALIVNANAPLGITTQTMRVYPPLKRLASRLITLFKTHDVREAFVFHPVNANLELYNLMRAVTGSGISYSEKAYDPENPNSILTAVKTQSARIAASPGKPAVLIFDNFRMVRHIVNILGTSIPGKSILFAGNQQWRSPALVVPHDDAMQGAVFVDFIGSYKNLPDQIDTPISDNEYFTTAQAASRIDYEIIGHRLGSLAVEATRFGISRHEIARRLQSMTNKWDSYFPRSELAFDGQRESTWPVFLFEVSGDTIREL